MVPGNGDEGDNVKDDDIESNDTDDGNIDKHKISCFCFGICFVCNGEMKGEVS